MIEINGVQYEQIVREKPSTKGYSKMSAMLAMASMFGGLGMMPYGGSGYTRKLPNNVDIVEEYRLIQQKKSRLSRWERDEVCRVFRSNFKRVEP